ncbi:MAG: hypothetical protein GW834_15625 [Cyanobacteria bacterium]|nr:hypothetical protein [Cyanobacteria bacterium CG_2015-09_32_10]
MLVLNSKLNGLKHSLLAIGLVILSLTSCATWESRDSINAAVWADDGTELAYILSEYEGKDNYPAGSDIRNQKFKVIRRTEASPEISDLTSFISGNANQLFYMKTMNYILVGLEEGDFYMYSLDGKLIKNFTVKSGSACRDRIGDFQRRLVVPSPDGKFLLRLETASNCTVQATFFRYENAVLDSIRSVTLPMIDFSSYSWLNKSTVIIDACNEFCGSEQYLLQLYGNPEKLSPDRNYSACLFVQTSSSYIRSDGKVIDISTDKITFGQIGEGSFSDLNVTKESYNVGCSLFLDEN